MEPIELNLENYFTIFTKRFIIDVRRGPIYASARHTTKMVKQNYLYKEQFCLHFWEVFFLKKTDQNERVKLLTVSIELNFVTPRLEFLLYWLKSYVSFNRRSHRKCSVKKGFCKVFKIYRQTSVLESPLF